MSNKCSPTLYHQRGAMMKANLTGEQKTTTGGQDTLLKNVGVITNIYRSHERATRQIEAAR